MARYREFTVTPRGRVSNPALAAQERDYSGLTWGRISPSDIDLVLTIRNKYFVYGEYKQWAGNLSVGQRIMLEHHARSLARAGKHVLCFVATHDDYPPAPIDGANARVTHYLDTPKGSVKWRPVPAEEQRTVREFLDEWFASVGLDEKLQERKAT